jgi:hypothetical protein
LQGQRVLLGGQHRKDVLPACLQFHVCAIAQLCNKGFYRVFRSAWTNCQFSGCLAK